MPTVTSTSTSRRAPTSALTRPSRPSGGSANRPPVSGSARSMPPKASGVPSARRTVMPSGSARAGVPAPTAARIAARTATAGPQVLRRHVPRHALPLLDRFNTGSTRCGSQSRAQRAGDAAFTLPPALHPARAPPDRLTLFATIAGRVPHARVLRPPSTPVVARSAATKQPPASSLGTGDPGRPRAPTPLPRPTRT
jgi:hypothetical protein